MAIFYSAVEGGFFDDQVHGLLPSDAVSVDEATWAQLLADQEAGFDIEPGSDGAPVSLAPPEPDLAQKKAQIAAEIAAEAERRASQLVPTRADLNELRRLIVTGASPTQEQLDRWALIDTLEEDAEQVRAEMETSADPYEFDYRNNDRWTVIP